MNILNHSKNIISFEIDKEFYIKNPNKSFLIEFPNFKNKKQIRLKDFTNLLPNPEQQFQTISKAIELNREEVSIQLNHIKNLNLEISELVTGQFIFFGYISDEKEILNLYLDKWETIKMSGDGVILGDSNGKIIFINPKITEFTEYSENDLLGKHISILFLKEELNSKPLRFDLLERGKEYLAKRILVGKNGGMIHVEMLSKKVKEGYITNIRNIEDRIKTENELDEIRKRLLFVANLENLGIIDINLDTSKVVYNEQMCCLLENKDFKNCTNLSVWQDMLHPDDKERVLEGLDIVTESNNSFNFVYRLNVAGKIKTIKAAADILLSDNNQTRKLIISSIDISNTSFLKNRVQELEQTFNALSNSYTNAIVIYREKFLYVNNGYEMITGYSKDEALNMNFWDIIHPDHQDLVKTRGIKRLKGESIVSHYDLKIKTKKGKTKWLELSASIIKYMGDYAAIGSAFDITKRKKLESDLKNNIDNLEVEKHKAEINENRFRQYMKQNSAAMIAVDTKTKRITFANKAAEELYEYDEEEFIELKIYDLQTLPKKEIDKRMKEALIHSSNEYVFQHKKSDKSIVNVKVNASPVKINDHNSMVLIIHDISEEIKSKTQLVESHATYKNILDSISEMLYILNKKGEFLYVNKASIINYQYEAQEIIGQTPAFLSAPDKNDLEDVVKKLKLAFNGEQQTIYFWGLRKDKSIFPKEVVLSPGYYFGEQVVIAVSRDISEHIRITKELTLAKEKAEESDRLKSAFLANMSHEIRTPMNAILGFSEIIKDPEMVQEERLKFINIINRSSNHLLNLINDLVDMSKIYSNQMPLSEDKFSLNSIFFEIFEFFEGELIKNEKKEVIDLTVSFGLPYGKDVILTDETRLRQILNNLLSNAIKFTDSGKIHFEYILEDNHIYFKVIDTGIGIEKNSLQNVFNRFVQEDSSISKRYGGTGLGLAISKACTELLKGEIWIESEKNKGTQVHLKIPHKKAN